NNPETTTVNWTLILGLIEMLKIIQVEILQSESGQVIKGFLERLADLVGTGLRRKPLWVPSGERVKQANLTRFLEFVNKKYGLSLGSYPELYRWSVEKPTEFWSAM